jgi:hypothetical protein
MGRDYVIETDVAKVRLDRNAREEWQPEMAFKLYKFS